jgi:hypothetical protein
MLSKFLKGGIMAQALLVLSVTGLFMAVFIFVLYKVFRKRYLLYCCKGYNLHSNEYGMSCDNCNRFYTWDEVSILVERSK